MGRSFFDLLRREDGVVAVIFAVMAIPFIAMAGWAVDYVRLQHVKDFLQAEADSAALSALHDEVNWSDVRTAMLAEVGRSYKGDWARQIEVRGQWLSGVDFEVVAEADVPLAFVKLIPGVGETQHVTATAVARVSEPELRYSPPEFAALEFEAWDFNRLWLYCFWPDRPLNDPTQPRRTQMVPIADNGGSEFIPDAGNPLEDDNPIQDALLRSSYEMRTSLGVEYLDSQEQGIWRQIKSGSIGERKYTYLMPQCPAGSHLSLRLENVYNALQDVREKKITSARWDSGGTRNNYYTDTISERGVADQHTGLGSRNILETIVCERREECVTEDDRPGTLIPPRQTNRNPQRATAGCSNGQYMYYGWEDRISGSDRDYDDIRVVMACPEEVRSGERNARLLS
ncbi:Tad domain-containing protein [Pelagibacterium sp. 26DY04]|uniref:TadE/TadG family type IV pilus assembly protein n=1 Tax=Pelagibacterium sp. 26DY04 TaxID=2967130 RepID=UPI0028167299|nr:Tad domain-containing protein [Pelagibacterium sp. 26DY04]WMT85429.1 Tad domain-containing protein [Pelagibacterium sp. 26DY04]